MGQNEDTEVTYQLASQDSAWEKINLIYCQLKIQWDGEKQSQKLKQLPLTTPLFQDPISLLQS